MRNEQIGNTLRLIFELSEKARFNNIREHNKDAFIVKEVTMDNGYCLELTPKEIIL